MAVMHEKNTVPLNKPIDAITEEDLQALVDESERESRFIDYKKDLALENDKTKAEFRRDAASFANALGGDMVIGIREHNQTKVPEELCGFDLTSENEEQFSVRLTKILQSRIKPIIRGVNIRLIKLASTKFAAVIRIPNSFAKPHQVEAEPGKPFEYWIRIDGAKERMDIDELRDTILAGNDFTKQSAEFSERRAGDIAAAILMADLKPGAKTMLHLVPIDAFRGRHSYDLAMAEVGRTGTGQVVEWPRFFNGGRSYYNFDGLVNCNVNDYGDTVVPGNYYIHFFRNGIVEAVENYTLNVKKKALPIVALQESLIERVEKLYPIMRSTGVVPPVAVMMRLIGVRGFEILLDKSLYSGETAIAIDRDDLPLPTVILTAAIADYSTISKLLRPVFDVIWQSCNYRACPYYDDDGNYNDSLTSVRLRTVLM